MTMKDKIEKLKVKDAVVRKVRMELTKLEGEFNEEFKGVISQLGLPEQFGLIDALDKALNHSEIITP